MSIEDIQYLLANSVQDSHLVIVDSSNRNKVAYPTPSEFMLTFDEPFANVFGIDVLDVAVSSTMYNIEKRNNKLICMNMWVNPDYSTIGKVSDEMLEKYYLSEIADYSPLNDMMVNGKNNEVLVIADVESEIALNFPASTVSAMDSGGRIVLEDGSLFALLGDNNVYKLGAGFDVALVNSIHVPNIAVAPSDVSVYGIPVTGVRTSNVIVYDLRKANGNHIAPFQFASYEVSTVPTKIALVKRRMYEVQGNFVKVTTIMESPGDVYFRIGSEIFRASGSLATKLNIIFTKEPYADMNNTVQKYYFNWNDVSYDADIVHLSNSGVRVWEPTNVIINDGNITFFEVDYITENTYYSFVRQDNVRWSPCIIFNSNVYFESGNYDLFGFVSYINSAIATARLLNANDDVGSIPYNFPFDDPNDIMQAFKINEQGDLTRTGRIRFLSNSSNVKFVIDMDNSTCLHSLGFSVVKSLYEDLLFHSVITKHNRNFVTSIKGADGKDILAPPGVINLTGVRYMVLRCPEIESRIFSSFAYGKFCPGIGMFKLSTNQETVQQRLDFVNFVKKPFHPIGRLQKLTFRFELPDGLLYDFRGVDMFMLLQIKYYAPKKKDVNPDGHVDSVLNPNYDPNYIRYMINRMAIDTQYSRNEDDGRVSSNAAKQIVRMQNDYDYSSEEEFDGHDGYPDEVSLYPRLT